MATKGIRKRKDVKKGEYTFVRLSLSAEEKEGAKSYSQKAAADIDVALTEVLASGYKVSFSYNETNDTVTCTFTGKPEESVNEFKMLTSFASSWWIALCVNLYKHWELFNGSVWEHEDDDEGFG